MSACGHGSDLGIDGRIMLTIRPEDEMDVAHSTHGRDEKYVQTFGRNAIW